MKRVLIAGVLGGLLLLGTPTLASSDTKEGRKSTEKSSGGEKKSDQANRGDRGHKADHGDRDGRGDRDHRDGRDGYRHRHHRRYHGGNYYGHPYHGGYYGRPYYGYDDYYYGGGGYDSAPRQGQVYVSGQAFNPPEVHSPVGARVLWLFQDGDVPHTVTANNGSFHSGNKVNDEYQLRFHHPGTYSYHCAIHPAMTGRVIVH